MAWYFRRAIMALLFIAYIAFSAIPAYADDVNILAKSAIVYCPDSGEILYSKNADAKMQMASTTKIMTTILALESGELDERFTVDEDAIMVEGSSMGLLPGDVVTKRILCYGMMLPSGNDAANATAVKLGGDVDLFVDMMNEKAHELGLENTNFVTPSGLDDYTDEHYSTAYDMAKLTAYALENEDFREICKTQNVKFELKNGRTVALYNSNRLLSTLEGCIGVKTGFTDKAGRCLITAVERNGATLICVTLRDSDDWRDHIELYKHCFNMLDTVEVGDVHVNIPVVGSDILIAKLKCDTESITLFQGEESKLTKKIYAPRFIYAPMQNGDSVGKVIYYLNGNEVISLDLKLSEDISIY